VEREKSQANQQKVQTVLSAGAGLLGAFLGGGKSSLIGRATTAARGAARVAKESGDVGRAQDTVEAIDQQINDLQDQLDSEARAIATSSDALTETLDTVVLRPKATGVTVRVLSLIWTAS
jgi:hypothetical protein